MCLAHGPDGRGASKSKRSSNVGGAGGSKENDSGKERDAKAGEGRTPYVAPVDFSGAKETPAEAMDSGSGAGNTWPNSTTPRAPDAPASAAWATARSLAAPS